MEDKKQKSFIVYLDEDDRKIAGWFEIISNNQFLITFKTTDENKLTIPLSRILKIKEKVNDDEWYK